jgi:hypothetical protein
MSDTIDPITQAQDLRERAATLLGADREYCLWLAQEWDKSAARHGHSRVPPMPQKRRAC